MDALFRASLVQSAECAVKDQMNTLTVQRPDKLMWDLNR